jgi:Ca2+/Na+ antiporter
MVLSILLVVASFPLLLGGAVLFTNSVEWLGARLGLGHGPTGSVLAAVATTLPESVIPVVAILAGEASGQIAIGAIIGAPFLLGMAVVRLSALAFRKRRKRGTALDLDQRATRRDLLVFLPLRRCYWYWVMARTRGGRSREGAASNRTTTCVACTSTAGGNSHARRWCGSRRLPG